MKKYLNKGDKIYVEGKIKTRKWQSEDGVQRYSTEIHVNEFNFLSNKNEMNQTEPSTFTPPTAQQPETKAPEDQADDLPF